MTDAIFKGDNTAAFGGNFLTIKVNNPDLHAISKLIFSVNGGCIQKPFYGKDYNNFQEQEILLSVNFDSSETSRLNASNVGNLIAYDENGLQYTCIQSCKFYAQNGVITNAKCGC